MKFDEPRRSEGLERFTARQNPFDSKKAEQVISIAKEWIRFGGTFYDHWTGKSPRLEKGVDYRMNDDGTPDMASYREARQKKIDAWLSEPGNKAWLADGQKFLRNHEHELSYGRENIGLKDVLVTPYSHENGWLYFESNFFDKKRGAMTQPHREPTAFRVYFDVDGGDVFPTYQEVIAQLSADLALRDLGFQIKTADVSRISPQEIGNIMHQKDRIVLYLGTKGMERALPILRRYGERNRPKFQKSGALFAQPLMDSLGKEISAIGFTSGVKGRSPDPETAGEFRSFGDIQAKIMESCFRSMRKAMKDPNTEAAMNAKYPVMMMKLAKLAPRASLQDFLGIVLADPHGEDFLARNMQTIYPQWAKAYGMRENNVAFRAAD